MTKNISYIGLNLFKFYAYLIMKSIPVMCLHESLRRKNLLHRPQPVMNLHFEVYIEENLLHRP